MSAPPEEEEGEGESSDGDLATFLSETEGRNPIVGFLNAAATRVGGFILRVAPALAPAIPSSGIYGSDDDDDDSVESRDGGSEGSDDDDDENWREKLGTGGIKHPTWLSSDSLEYHKRRRTVDVQNHTSMFNYDHVRCSEEEGEEEQETGFPKLGPRRLTLLHKFHLRREYRGESRQRDPMQMRTCLLRTYVGGIRCVGIESAALTFEFWKVNGCELMHKRKLRIRGGVLDHENRVGLTLFSYLHDVPAARRVQEWALFAALGKDRVLEGLVEPVALPRRRHVDRWYFNAHGNKKFHKTSFLAHWLCLNQSQLFEDRITPLPLYKVWDDPDAVCIPRVAHRHVATVMRRRVFTRLPIVTPASVSVRVSRVRTRSEKSDRHAISFEIYSDVIAVPEEVSPLELVTPIQTDEPQ